MGLLEFGIIINSYNNGSVTCPNGKNYGVGGLVGNSAYNGGTSYIYNCYTLINTTICGYITNSSQTSILNCYTTEANTKLDELNTGIDSVGGTDTLQPWIEGTDGYPILKWQVEEEY